MLCLVSGFLCMELHFTLCLLSIDGEMFTPAMSNVEVTEEGSDYLIGCLLTDPSATDLSLRLTNGSAVPQDMNYTVDPKRGILVRGLLPHHSGEYVCSASVRGKNGISEPYGLIIRPSKTVTRIPFIDLYMCPIIPRLWSEYPVLIYVCAQLWPDYDQRFLDVMLCPYVLCHVLSLSEVRSPPGVLMTVQEPIRIVGEKLQIQCTCTNPNRIFSVTWTHASGRVWLISSLHETSFNWMYFCLYSGKTIQLSQCVLQSPVPEPPLEQAQSTSCDFTPYFWSAVYMSECDVTIYGWQLKGNFTILLNALLFDLDFQIHCFLLGDDT